MIYCKIEGCTGQHESKGFCKKHYQRFIKYGDPMFTKFSKDRKQTVKPPHEPKPHGNSVLLDFEEVNGCFICTSHVYKNRRYAMMHLNKVNWAVHRLVYTEMFGEIPKGLVVMHTCDNTHCINPEHLVLGTQGDNVRDCVTKGRHRNGASR